MLPWNLQDSSFYFQLTTQSEKNIYTLCGAAFSTIKCSETVKLHPAL